MAVNRSSARTGGFSGQALIPLGRTHGGDEPRLPDATPLRAPKRAQASHLEAVLEHDSFDDKLLEMARVFMSENRGLNNRQMAEHAVSIREMMERASVDPRFREPEARAKFRACLELMDEIVASLDLADRNTRLIFGA